MTPLELLGVLVTGLLLCATVALAVAGRSLGHLQRRTWVGADDEDDADETGSAVETAFIALRIARQLLLILLAALAVRIAGEQWPANSLAYGVGLAVAAYLVFAKLLPYGMVIVLGTASVLRLGAPVFFFVRNVFGPLARYLSRTVERARVQHRHNGTDERGDLGAFLELAEEEGMVSEAEEALLRGVADFEEAVVREVMTPRVDIISIDVEATLGDLRRLIAQQRYSRIPVVRGDVDHVVGVVNLKDLVAALEEGGDEVGIGEISRPVWFVPETKRVSQLLQEFQKRQEQIAVVVDEYGGTAGLVTLEDLVEEIVGEIQDEDEPQRMFLELDGDGVIVSGNIELEDVEEALGVEIQKGDFHTVGGLVFTRLGRVPDPGETVDHGDLAIEVLEADDRRIRRVRITSR